MVDLTYNDHFSIFLSYMKVRHPGKTEQEYRELAKAETRRHIDKMREADEYIGGK